MNIFFIADTHLGHENALKWGYPSSDRGRRFSCIEEHDEFIVDNFNNNVGKRDTTFFLGDVAWNKQGLDHLDRLNGIKHLIWGNHDKYLRDYYVHKFNTITGVMKFKKDFVLSHMPIHPKSVRPRYKWNIHGHIHLYDEYGPEYVNVSVERINYTPINFETIKEIVNQRILPQTELSYA